MYNTGRNHDTVHIHFSLHLSNTWPLPSDNSLLQEYRLFNACDINVWGWSTFHRHAQIDMSTHHARYYDQCHGFQSLPPSSLQLGDLAQSEDALCEANILNNLDPVVWTFLAMVCLKVPPTHTLTPSGVDLPHHGLPQGTTNTHTNTQWCGPSSPWSASRYHQHTH